MFTVGFTKGKKHATKGALAGRRARHVADLDGAGPQQLSLHEQLGLRQALLDRDGSGIRGAGGPGRGCSPVGPGVLGVPSPRKQRKQKQEASKRPQPCLWSFKHWPI